MNNSDFDKILREKMESYSEQVDGEIWKGIEGRLSSIHRKRIFIRFSIYTAAAACLLAGLFLFPKLQEINEKKLSGHTPFADSGISESSTDKISDKSVSDKDIISIEEQIKALSGKTAIALKTRSSKQSKIKDAYVSQGVNADVEKEDIASSLEAENDDTSEGVDKESARADNQAIKKEDNKNRSDEKYGRLGYWDQEPQTVKRKRHTSFTISSNVSSVASEGSFVYKMSPAHSSSSTGKNSGYAIEPVSEPDYSMPVSFGLQLRYSLTDKISVGAGLNYTYLQSSFKAVINKEYFDATSSQLHYMGIPVNVFYTFGKSRNFNFYASAGGVLEKCVKSRYVYASHTLKGEADGVQLSVNAGLGIEYRIVPKLGIYIDPSVAYYFDNNQPRSIRTAQPLQMRVELGLRMSL